MSDISHLHSMTVHFPIALILVGFLVDLAAVFLRRDACLPKTGYLLQVFGLLGTIVAFGTGYYLTGELAGEAGLMRGEHKLFATFTLVFIILATMLRVLITYIKKEQSGWKWVVLCLYLCSFIFVIYTGYLGGTLVRDYLMGI